MNPKSDIRGLINQLHRNADLLEAAYFSGAIAQTDENLAALRSLHDARIMAPIATANIASPAGSGSSSTSTRSASSVSRSAAT